MPPDPQKYWKMEGKRHWDIESPLKKGLKRKINWVNQWGGEKREFQKCLIGGRTTGRQPTGKQKKLSREGLGTICMRGKHTGPS